MFMSRFIRADFHEGQIFIPHRNAAPDRSGSSTPLETGLIKNHASFYSRVLCGQYLLYLVVPLFGAVPLSCPSDRNVYDSILKVLLVLCPYPTGTSYLSPLETAFPNNHISSSTST